MSSSKDHPYQNRIKSIRSLLLEIDIDGAIISDRSNIHYLTGLTQLHPDNREALLIVTQKDVLLYHSFFLHPPHRSWLGCQVMSKAKTISTLLSDFFDKSTHLGYEAKDLVVSEYHQFESILDKTEFSPIDSVLSKLRSIKSDSEIELIQKAIVISQQTMDYAHQQLKENIDISEIQLTHQINQHMLELGAQDQSFPTIVAFDEHSASPHHIPTQKKLTLNSVVLIDLGAKYMSYNSDMTRTIKLGKKSSKFSQIKQTVDQAYQSAIEALEEFKENTTLSPLTSSQLDNAARSIISAAGFTKEFPHTTGHGLGLDIHETPSISPNNHTPIKKNMVFTIEPGIYLEGIFGYRHENTLILN